MKVKICYRCNRELPATAEYFRRDKAKKDGLRPSCKECEGSSFTIKENLPKGYKRCTKCNKVLPATLEYFHKCKTSVDGLRSDCKKCKGKATQEWYEENKENKSKYHKQWYRKNKKERTEYYKQWAEENREKSNANKNLWNQKRKAMKNKLPATLTNKQWRKIKQDFNNECAYCGQVTKLTQEHFIPLSKGGEYTRNNIIPVCKSCNCSKNNSDFFEWYPKQEFYNKQREDKILEYLNYISEDIQQLSIL